MIKTDRISHFLDIPQNEIINKLYELDSRRTRSVDMNPYSCKLRSEKSDFVLSVTDASTFQWVPSTRRLFALIREDYYRNHSPEIRIPVSSYAELCQRKSIKEFRSQLRKDLEALLQIKLPLESTTYSPLLLKAGLQGGYIVVVLSSSFVKVLNKRKGAIQLPYLYFEISDKQFRHASDLLYYITLMRFLNNKKENVRDHISIGKLLEVTALPSLEEVQQTKNGSIRERIVQPFFNNLHALDSELSFVLVHNGFQISEGEAQKLDFYEFKKVCIHFSWVHESELRQYVPKGTAVEQSA
mgnify:FL=1